MDLRDPHVWRTLTRQQLASQLAQGHSIERDKIEGWVYRGISLGLPRLIEAFAWVNFAKTFTNAHTGWNIRCEQLALDKPSVYQTDRKGHPKIFGPYSLTALDGAKCPIPCGPGLLIDYSIGGRAAGTSSWPRDPLVAVFAGDTDYLLGWSYLEVGSTAIKTPSYFLLIRDRPLDHDWASVHLSDPWRGTSKE
jgi:hypothetical protein